MFSCTVLYQNRLPYTVDLYVYYIEIVSDQSKYVSYIWKMKVWSRSRDDASGILFLLMSDFLKSFKNEVAGNSYITSEPECSQDSMMDHTGKKIIRNTTAPRGTWYPRGNYEVRNPSFPLLLLKDKLIFLTVSFHLKMLKIASKTWLECMKVGHWTRNLSSWYDNEHIRDGFHPRNCKQLNARIWFTVRLSGSLAKLRTNHSVKSTV